MALSVACITEEQLYTHFCVCVCVREGEGVSVYSENGARGLPGLDASSSSPPPLLAL